MKARRSSSVAAAIAGTCVSMTSPVVAPPMATLTVSSTPCHARAALRSSSSLSRPRHHRPPLSRPGRHRRRHSGWSGGEWALTTPAARSAASSNVRTTLQYRPGKHAPVPGSLRDAIRTEGNCRRTRPRYSASCGRALEVALTAARGGSRRTQHDDQMWSSGRVPSSCAASRRSLSNVEPVNAAAGKRC